MFQSRTNDSQADDHDSALIHFAQWLIYLFADLRDIRMLGLGEY